MSVSQPDKQRRLLPRWQPSKRTIAAGELRPATNSAPALTSDDEHFEQRKEEWERVRSIDVAAELVGSAIVLGRTHEVEAAVRLLAEPSSDVSATLREMARLAVGASIKSSPKRRLSRPGRLERPVLYEQISKTRQHLHQNPRDAYAYIDLARLYTILGQNEKARHVIHAALAIAPEDRFVLRASARYFVHVDEPEAALRVLARARATAQDPWLMAAEIAVSQVAQRAPRNVARAQRALQQGRWAPRSGSELAGSLATLMLKDGADQQARQLFRQSLVDPTENAVAQAEWASAETSGLIVPEQFLRDPNGHEARALHDRVAGHWSDAIERCWDWVEYEPTSTRPLLLGSYVAAVAHEDGNTIIEFADRGLAAEPNNTILQNNKAVGLAYLGQFEEATALLKKIIIERSPTAAQPALYATTGLLFFRLGDLENGRLLYEKAITHPHSRKDRWLQALALWHLAIEESRVGTPEATSVIGRAELASKGLKVPEFGPLRARAAAALKRAPVKSAHS